MMIALPNLDTVVILVQNDRGQVGSGRIQGQSTNDPALGGNDLARDSLTAHVPVPNHERCGSIQGRGYPGKDRGVGRCVIVLVVRGE